MRIIVVMTLAQVLDVIAGTFAAALIIVALTCYTL
jgi:hypothetical protein